MNVSSFITKYYENFANWTLGENKSKTKPNKANIMLMLPEWARIRGKKLFHIAKMENVAIIIAVN
jgi:hypothetical protein